MMYSNDQFISADSHSWKGVLIQDISKSRSALQPIFEGITNAIEAIKIRQKEEQTLEGEILIKIYATESTVEGSTHFYSLSILDNGIGFNDDEFKRFNTYKLANKGFKNLGSGRIQYVHHFDSVLVKSVFLKENKHFERVFRMSKQDEYLKNNSIVKHISCLQIENKPIGTELTFITLLENSPIYNNLNQDTLKEEIIEKYIHYLCYHKSDLPKIKIQYFVQSKLIGEQTISKSDLPEINKTLEIPIYYSKFSDDAKSLISSDKFEKFTIDAFKIPKIRLNANDLKLVSKGEIVEKSDVKLQNIAKKEIVEGNRYLFLISSNYIDENDSDVRGNINIPTRESFMKKTDIFKNEAILIESIQSEVNLSISQMYSEIEKVKEEHNNQLSKLKEMFLLDEETSKEINISINDSESEILEKYYEAEAKKTATLDASIKESIDNLNSMDTNSPNYLDNLKKEADNLITKIPIQNKRSLAHYVARRKLVLELFQKILDKETEKLSKGGRIDEDIMHNLIFQQSSDNTGNSDLWLIAEEFIYFKGFSEYKLNNIEIDGVKIFKDKFSEEEERYLKSLGENRLTKRSDILLFPEEGKCIIIEFKAPDVNVSEHLSQIDFYASLIRNYTIDGIEITTFYGYLIGESIEDRDVRGRVSRFEHSFHLGYWFRPSENVIHFDGGKDGNLYTEVIKFSTLLERAKLRNKIFIEKLGIVSK